MILIRHLKGHYIFKVTKIVMMLAVIVSIVGINMVAVSANSDSELLIKEKMMTENTSIRGDKLDVNLLLRAIGRQASVNMVVNENITGTISLDLVDVNLYDVFQLLMESKKLRYYVSNNAVLVERAEDFKAEKKDIETVRLCARYGDVANHLKELEVVKSEDGTLTVSNDGNCLIARDHEENVVRIKALLNELDGPLPQVHIKAQIVTINKKAAQQLGIKWGYQNFSSKNPISADVDLAISNPTTDIVFGFIRDNNLLDIELSALQEKNQLYVLSAPRIVVLDGEEAEIKQGQEIPYETGTAENRDTEFREALLSLNVVPKILQNEFIRLNLKVTNDSVDMDNQSVDGQPLINRQEIRTNLFLEDGVTVVVGGIIAKNKDLNNQEVPFLSDIPILGNLFKSHDDSDTTSELLVFLTPTIMHNQRDLVSPEKVFDENGNLIEKKLQEYSGKNMEKVLDPKQKVPTAPEPAPVDSEQNNFNNPKGTVNISPMEILDNYQNEFEK